MKQEDYDEAMDDYKKFLADERRNAEIDLMSKKMLHFQVEMLVQANLAILDMLNQIHIKLEMETDFDFGPYMIAVRNLQEFGVEYRAFAERLEQEQAPKVLQ